MKFAQGHKLVAKVVLSVAVVAASSLLTMQPASAASERSAGYRPAASPYASGGACHSGSTYYASGQACVSWNSGTARSDAYSRMLVNPPSGCQVVVKLFLDWSPEPWFPTGLYEQTSYRCGARGVTYHYTNNYEPPTNWGHYHTELDVNGQFVANSPEQYAP